MSTLQDTLGHLSPAKRELVRRRLAALNARAGRERSPEMSGIPRVARGGDLPLSFAQQRLWFIERLEGPGALYNEFAGEIIEGPLDVAALEASLAEMLRRHEILRTVFPEVDGSPVQRIEEHAALPLAHQDLQGVPEADRGEKVRRIAEAEARLPFDLVNGPLARFTLLTLGPVRHVLLVSMHHVVCDRWSTAVFVREISKLYAACCGGTPSPLPDLPTQYVDYAVWQRSQLETPEAIAELGEWVEALHGAPFLLELPGDRPRPAVQGSAGAAIPFALDDSLTLALNRRSREFGVTPFMTLHAALLVLVYRYTGRRDIVIGAPVANRELPAVEDLIGFFVNTLPLRVEFDPSRPFAELVDAVRRADADAFARRQTPLERLVQEVQPERSLSHSPLFQLLFVFQNSPVEDARIPGLTLTTFRSESVTAKFDLTIALAEEGGRIAGAFEYSTELFDRDRIERMAGHFRQVLTAALANPRARLTDLRIMEEAEERQLDAWSSASAAPHPASSLPSRVDPPLHELFMAQAGRTPHATATTAGSERLSYAQLDEASDRLAGYLRRIGVGPEVLVGLCLERSTDVVVALLAIHKAGGAYLPLDPAYPRERLAYVLRDSGAAVVIGTRQTLSTLPSVEGVPTICLDDQRARIEAEPRLVERPTIAAANRAYVIYTSGSTGQPKGVVVQHGGLSNLALAQSRVFGVGAGSRVLQFASLSFDASISEVAMALCSGATLVLASAEQIAPGSDLQHTLASEAVTHVTLPPAALIVMSPASLPDLSTLIVAGEPCPGEIAVSWARGRRFFNAYGPTETTVCATICDYPGAGTPMIGTPMDGARVYIVDAGLTPVPIGIPGELCIGGAGVGRGYLSRPDLTAEQFLPDPFSGIAGSRLYRSGDLARFGANGVIEYLGRIDHQVKIRGFRIELEEVSRALDAHPSVLQSIVTVVERAGDRRLAAYYVAAGPVDDVRAFLERTLPAYMVPSFFVRLDELPLTIAGKIDRQRLPQPGDASGEATAVRDGIEEVVADLFRRVLGSARVGLRGSFFDSGGHSLLAVQLLARVRDTWAVELGLREFFASPTIDSVARLVRERIRAAAGTSLPPIERIRREVPVPLSFAQRRLWFLDQLEGPNATYNISAALRLEGDIDLDALGRSFTEIVGRHESLRTTFPAVDGVPVQRVAPAPSQVLTVESRSGVGPEARADAMRAATDDEADLPFNLEAGPLFRARLIGFAAADHLLLVTMHHIVSDGWSMALLIRDLASLYGAFVGGRSALLAPLSIQYADFAAWQQQWLAGARLERELEFWRQQMAGAPALLELPTDRPRPAVRSSRGRLEHFELDAGLTKRLREAGARCGATLFMTLMAGFVTVLSRYSRQQDVVIGTGMANRNHTDTESVVGLFVNTLVLRTDLSGDPTFADLIGRVRKVALDAYVHQDVPFEKLVEELQPERSLSHTPLFQVMFAMQNVPSGALHLPGVRVTALEPDRATAKFDLTVFLEETQGGVAGSVVYSTDLFDGTTVARLLRHYANLLAAAATDAECRISALPLMDATETRHVVRTFPASRAAAPGGCLHERFEAVVLQHPDRTAVSLDERPLTYRELNARASRLARHLQSLGVGPDALVGLCLERSLDLIVGVLAILKAGGAYVPLDPSYPADRLAFMIEDSGLTVLLTAQSLLDTLPPHEAVTCCIDAEWPAIERHADTNLAAAVTGENLCYVIYTSGSTGRPKGALIRHRNVTRLFDATEQWFHFDEQDVWTLFHSSAFDFSVWEMWGPLLYGGRLVVVPYLVSRSPAEFHQLLRRERVTVLNQTPSAFSQLMEADRDTHEDLDALRFVIFGGEALDLRSLRPWVARYGDDRPRLVNMYGITETTVHVTWRPLGAADLESPRSLIGVPIPDLELYVLDEHMHPVPPGVPGELHVGGQGLARGYLNRPDLTAERFVPNPFAAADTRGGTCLYRTGDMVRLLKDDELEYLGRVDDQIKIRGFRVEPGEIETALVQHEAVRDALVLARQDEGGDKRLIAYVVPDAAHARPLLRLLQWQREGTVASGAFFQLPNGMTVAHLNRMETEFVYHEIFEEQSYLRHGIALPDEACIVDVGANIGLFSLFAARSCRQPRIYAFEPIPATFECLRLNTELHGLTARIFEYGLAAEERIETFTFYPNVSIISGRFGDVAAEKQMVRAFLLKQQETSAGIGLPMIDELLDERLQREAVSCRLRPLSDVLSEEAIDVVDLLKIDVEKSELDVLGGIRDEDWPRIRQVIVEVHGSDGRLDTVVCMLRDQGFTVTVDRDALLTDTDLFNVYASRSTGYREPSRDLVAPSWSSPHVLAGDLRDHLETRLPAYMVPSAIVLLDRFPLTINGKIDRRALPGPQQTHEVASSRYLPPRHETETRLAAIFTEVLRVPRIGIDESFFDAGGHSLLATQVVSRVREAFHLELPLQALFQSPTIAALAQVLQDRRAPAARVADRIGRRVDTGVSRLSFAQERLWFLDQLEPGNPFYNVPLALRLRGRLDVKVLERSLHEVLRRHEVLRARFVALDGTPVQIVRSVDECGVQLAEGALDLTGVVESERSALVDALAVEEATRPFNLADDPLLRVKLVYLEPDEAILLFTMHHIVSDGWSLGVLVHELGTLYEAFERGQASPLVDPPLQYADFAAWQREWLTGETLERQIDYWKTQLAGVPPVLELPTDRQRPPTQSFRGGSHRFEIGPELTAGLRDLSRRHDATLFMTLLAVLAALLHRYTGQPEIVIGAPIANRTRREIEPLIGFFVNTLALRTDLGGQPSFSALLRRVRGTTLEAYAHQDLPFERLVDEIQPERDLSLNPLFQVMFALQNAPLEPLALTGLQVEALERPATSALFDLVLDVWEADERLVGNLQFNTDLFDAATVARLATHYATLAAAVAAAPERPVSGLGLLPAEESAALLAVGQGPRMTYPVDQPLAVLFEAVAAARPEAVAARHGGRGITYAALNARANQIARWLRAAGVGREDFVGLLDRRGIDLLAAMLGVLKAGGAFLPVDAAYPADRIGYMLTDSGVRTVITRASVLAEVGELPAAGAPRRVLDLDTEALDSWPADNLPAVSSGHDIAYLLYTSGSTGVPKGAMVRHDGAVNHLCAEFDLLRFHPGTVFLQSAPSSSDISVWQFLAPGLAGGRTVIADYETVADPARLFVLLREEQVTLIELVPVVLKGLLDHVALLPPEARALPALEWAMVTGEAVSVALVHQWIATYPSVPIVNAYGPTEAADDICQAVFSAPLPADARSVPIGRPLANLRLYVLDRAQQLVPFGVVGEICVSGIGVGAGYWQNAAATAAALVANPYAEGPDDAVLYRTGDWGRWGTDGTLECLGRLDSQVKVRGFRIELGEIEGVLARHPSVAMSAVTTTHDESGEGRLVAYVVPDAAAAGVRQQLESLHGEQIALWRRLHEDSYTDRLLRQDDPTFNVIGWDSNYTNEALPEEDMREYVDCTVERILALKPRRVLEIGCGTGLIFFTLLPHCDAYCGTDLSQVAIRQLSDLQRDPDLQRRIPGLDRALLLQTRADELVGVAVDRFDTAILPSVVQYFPSVEYLLDVLERLFGTLTPGATIFLGDVRSLPLLEAFHLSVQLHKSPGTITVAQLAARVRQQLEREQELAIDPAFFMALQARFPQISSVEVLPKRGTHPNEMTRFRYDVRIRTATPVRRTSTARLARHEAGDVEIRWEEWHAGRWPLDRIRRELESGSSGAWGLRGVANARVHRELAALAWIAGGAPFADAAALSDALLSLPNQGLEPEDLWALERDLPYRIHVNVASGVRDGSFDVAFVPRDLAQQPPVALSVPASEPWTRYANNPLREKLRRELGAALREHLRSHVPQYMMPSEFVFMDVLPLTPAGKVDRRALPEPAALRVVLDDTYVAPRTPGEEALCAIWCEVLGLERVGIRSNFFELGGHSLKATQVTSRIRRDLHVEIPLRQLFVSPTIEELAERVRATAAAERAPGTIPRAPDAEHYPLSHAQRRLWVLCQMEGGSSAYNIPGAVLLEGPLSVSVVRQALDQLVARHESLRTAFIVVDGEPRQQVLPSVRRELVLVDLMGHASPDDEARARALEDARAPFDLQAGGLLRASLLCLAPERHLLLFNVHHIVSDDWSGGVLVRELVQLYRAGVAALSADAAGAKAGGVERILPPLAIQYRDYAVWQNATLQRDGMASHRTYWLQKLSGDIPAVDLPTDLPRPAVKTYNGSTHSFALTPEETARLLALARDQGASPFMLLVAAVKTLLFRYTSQSDSIVGFPIAGRTEPELEHQIGFFINMLPLRDSVDASMSFESFLQQVKRTATDAYEHQQYPFDRIVNELDLNRDVSRTPLFDVVVVLQNATPAALDLPGVRVEPLALEYGFSKFDLSFAFEQRGGRLCCDLVYNTDLFRENRIRRMGGHFTSLVRSVLEDVSRPLAAIDILPDEERRLVLEEWSGAGSPLPAGANVVAGSLIETFARVVGRHADRVAVTLPGSRQMTYRELNASANRAAQRLRRLGVGPNALVGLCVERGLDMIVGILGILKAGGAYVPLDPAWPSERVRFILEDTGARVLLTQEHLAPGLPSGSAEVVCVDADGVGDERDADGDAHACGEDAAYVIYTSGSTGQPKGVLVTRANVSRLFASTDRWFGFNERDVWTLFHSYTFDFSVWEIWGALLHGGRLVIVPRDVSRSPEAFHALVAAERVTVLNQTPSAFKPFMGCAVASTAGVSLRYVIFGGEALDTESLRPWFDEFGDRQPQLVNMYGITETTVHVTYRPLSRQDLERPASVIGVPIPDLRLYILDAERRPVPVGVRGELYVGGAGLARGYVNRPALTAERFIDHGEEGYRGGGPPAQRLYRTGDLARFLDDGDIEYLGRADHQVKIRGFRVELGEIEAALAAHPAIAEAVVIARRDADAARLVAYLVARGDAPDPASLRAHLQRTLPEYMVPSAFVALPSFPLTANGKLDRAALPDPDTARLPAAGFVELSAGSEQTIAAIVRDVLRVGRVGAHDNFFDLGADSLLLAMVHTRLRDALGCDLPLVALYQHPTVSALAASLAPPAVTAKDVGRAVDERAARQRQARRPRRKD